MTADRPKPVPMPETSHPYAVRIPLKLGSNIELQMDGDDMRLPFTENFYIRLLKQYSNPQEQANHIKHILIDLEAFPSASEAERAGKLLTASLLWVAASERVTIGFEKWTGKYPFAVRDRTESDGFVARLNGRVFFTITPEEMCLVAASAFRRGVDVAPNVLASMEFYASARMESTERARFIGLITALEALSVKREYGDVVADLVTGLAAQLENSPLLAGEDNAALRSSLLGRVKDLRRESVSQAIIRTVREHINDKDTKSFIEEAYRARSKILHEGIRVNELHTKINRLENVLRQMYSGIMGLELVRK